MEFRHKSVLLEKSIDALRIKPDGIYVDGTLGGGGHSFEICRRLSDKGRLIGIDQDGAAIQAASRRLGEFQDRVTVRFSLLKKKRRCCRRSSLSKAAASLKKSSSNSFGRILNIVCPKSIAITLERR